MHFPELLARNSVHLYQPCRSQYLPQVHFGSFPALRHISTMRVKFCEAFLLPGFLQPSNNISYVSSSFIADAFARNSSRAFSIAACSDASDIVAAKSLEDGLLVLTRGMVSLRFVQKRSDNCYNRMASILITGTRFFASFASLFCLPRRPKEVAANLPYRIIWRQRDRHLYDETIQKPRHATQGSRTSRRKGSRG